MDKFRLALSAGLVFAFNAALADEGAKCDAVFNPAKKFCHDGEVYDLCDGMKYDPTTHICSGDIAYRAFNIKNTCFN